MGAKKMGSKGGVKQHTLTREGSLYSLTLDEVESQLGNLEKPLSCMNPDEILKTVWTASEARQGVGLSVGKQPSELAASSPAGRCQPNLMVSKELSTKTVDEVWKSIQCGRAKNNQMGKDQGRQTTLGEMTLEDLLSKAGIVSGLTRQHFSQQSHWMQYELSPVEQTQARHQQLRPSISGFMASDKRLQQQTHTGLNHLMDAAYPETQPGVTMSPTRGTLSDTQTLGRKRIAPGEVVERRQKRMIKNRESAARSRARKQAHTNELENKISYLEEEIERLKKQQAVEKEVQYVPPDPKPQLCRTNSGPQ